MSIIVHCDRCEKKIYSKGMDESTPIEGVFIPMQGTFIDWFVPEGFKTESMEEAFGVKHGNGVWLCPDCWESFKEWMKK